MNKIIVNRKLIAYILFVLFFISLLFASNFFVMQLTTEHHLREDSLNNYNNKVQVNIGIDKILRSNLWGRSQVAGWAFCETGSFDENRSLTYLFVSDKKTYSLDIPFTHTREDVAKVYENKGIKFENRMIGYNNDFSTINMSEGIYQLYIYCNENEQDYGLIKTDYFFEKKGTDFEPYVWRSQVVDNKVVSKPQVKAVVALDATKVVEDNIELRGWALIEGQDCASQTIYIKVTAGEANSRLYTTLSGTRTDVAKGYKNEQYTNCGYIARIPLNDLDNGRISVEIISKNNDQVGISKKYILQKDGSSVEITNE